MIKIKSEITKKEVYAVEATVRFIFGKETVSHDVYWASTDEIFPKQKGYCFGTLMDDIYGLPRDIWKSKLLDHSIFNNAPQYNSCIFGNSKRKIYTNKDIVAKYIKQ